MENEGFRKSQAKKMRKHRQKQRNRIKGDREVQEVQTVEP